MELCIWKERQYMEMGIIARETQARCFCLALME